MSIDQIKNRIKTEVLVTKYLTGTQLNTHHNYYDCFQCHQKNKIVVNPKTNMYRCFKCDVNFKDIFDLYQNKFQVNFSTAFQVLIKEIDLTASALSPIPTRSAFDLKTKYRILTKTASYYHYLLKKYQPDNAIAINYLQNIRRLTIATINEFQLGFAPPPHTDYQWTSILTRYFLREQVPLALPKSLNLVVNNPKPQNNYGLIDAFYNAIIIPKTTIINSKMQVIGLKANLLKVANNTPKYLELKKNTFIQPKNYLYRLHEHLPFINAQKQVIIYESEYDVMKSYQFGIKNVVAFGGKDFTSYQLSQIFKYIPKNYEILIILDHDAGGIIKMHELYLKLIKNHYLRVKAIGIPQYKSVDDFLNHHDYHALTAILNSSQYLLTLNNY